LAVMSLGGDGIVSVISNATPKLMTQLCACMRLGDLDAASEIHFRLLPWMRAAFIESNPLPVKAALAMMGRIKNVLRLPLVPMLESHNDTVRAALKTAGALS
jgi:4-hydroxy-tetrahydrodipicolinate synthase